MHDSVAETGGPSSAVLDRLVANHRGFLTFLEARLPDRAAAEEVLQAAFVKTLEKGATLRDEESAVAWFYRLLRNALADHYRRRDVARRVSDRLALEAAAISEPALRAAVCTCVRTLLPTLKPEYAAVLARVDLDEAPLAQVAAELALTTNNATVRLHRARRALKRRLEESCGTCAMHGCLDCSCQVSPAPRRRS